MQMAELFWYVIHTFTGCGDSVIPSPRNRSQEICTKCGRRYFKFQKH